MLFMRWRVQVQLHPFSLGFSAVPKAVVKTPQACALSVNDNVLCQEPLKAVKSEAGGIAGCWNIPIPDKALRIAHERASDA